MSSKIDYKWLAIGAMVATALISTIVINVGHDNGNKIERSINADNGDLKINWDKYETTNVALGESYTINKSGVYHLTGELENGLVSINVKDGVVKLILDNVTIKNPYGPAIVCYEADDLVIELVGKNTLEDGENYAANLDEDVKGVVYSKADLTFIGEGSLLVTAKYQDGIVSKDDLKFNGGEYTITAKDDGIRGKDSIYVVDGAFTIEAGGDGMKSTNETTAGKGFVLIEQGTFNITASAKGIKAINSILIHDGNFTISSKDDGIHSNNYVGIMGANIEISSGDDGIHADKELIVDAGVISVLKSYEGLEAKAITINGGETSVVASDDGMNAGGGNDASANNRPGANPFDADTSCTLTINGGKIYVNAAGDGLDSNGFLTFNGGEVVVDGPTNNGNGALDSGSGISFNGGSVIAVGASGMAESLGTSSSINNVSIFLTSTQKAGTKIEIKNSAGETVLGHTSLKAFNHIAAGTEKFEEGETYTLYLNGTKTETFTISGIVTTVGSNSGNQMPNQQMRQR
ncbi:carbohydrate-binding domain-containing protein [Candidatus Saccharibacteria bacterium]|nr:carbohydrate-binding domain-containing protein [Candidatus Saccharibacteria bacterium]